MKARETLRSTTDRDNTLNESDIVDVQKLYEKLVEVHGI